MYKNIIAVIVLTAFSISLFAQTRQYTNNANSWFMYFGTHKIADKWSLHLEGQLRRSDGLSIPQQFLVRPGINYHLSPQVMFSAGYAFIETYPYGAVDFAAKSAFPENRIWEQLQLKHQVGAFEWVSRFRLEQRYVQSPVLMVGIANTFYAPGAAIYTNRFRLLNRFSIPFKGKTIVDKSFYLSVYDEFMVNFGENVGLNIFDQNRIYVAIGYKFPKIGRLEVGYLNQLIIKSDGKKIENNNTFNVGLSCNLDFMKKKEVVAPK
jgi:Protein of unknown function (DUF2490)